MCEGKINVNVFCHLRRGLVNSNGTILELLASNQVT